MESKNESNSIGIIGSGMIGKNWAMIFASAGHSVVLYDTDQKQLDAALKDIKASIHKYEVEKTLRGTLSAEEQINLITSTSDLRTCLRNKQFIQECIPEVEELKINLYKAVDKLADNEVILSSSTSSILPSVFSENLQHKTQVIVSHPLNPPYFVRLVEIVPAPWTSASVIKKTELLMRDIGQSPVVLSKEISGFAVNRIQNAILNQCWDLVEEGILDAPSVDKVMSEGLGIRYAFLGPLETAHLNGEGFLDYSKRFSESIYATCKTYKPIPKLSGPQAKVVEEQLCVITPLEKLSARRAWRDMAISKLAKLKENINEKY